MSGCFLPSPQHRESSQEFRGGSSPHCLPTFVSHGYWCSEPCKGFPQRQEACERPVEEQSQQKMQGFMEGTCVVLLKVFFLLYPEGTIIYEVGK